MNIKYWIFYKKQNIIMIIKFKSFQKNNIKNIFLLEILFF